jgi:hypothetical protein
VLGYSFGGKVPLAYAAAVGAHGYPPGVGQWMAMNLEPADDGEYRWRIDFDSMELLLRDFFRTDLWEVVEAAEGPEIHLVRAEAAGRRNGRLGVHALPREQLP